MKIVIQKLLKAITGGHKYVKREGAPGHYKYIYRLPDGSIGCRADLNAGKDKKDVMSNENAKKLFFDLLHFSLKRSLKNDDVDEYETTDGGIGYIVTLNNKSAAKRAKDRWEKSGGYASFNEDTGKLELSTTPLLGQKRKETDAVEKAIARIRKAMEAL
jgi:hypothetical protein